MVRIPAITISTILGFVALACGGSAATTAIPASTAVPTFATPALAAYPTSTPTVLPTPVSTQAGGSTLPDRPPTIAPVVEAQTGSTDPPEVDELTERVEDALSLASRGNWLEAWEFYTLSFSESCPKEIFAAQAGSGMNFFRGMLGLPFDAPLEFRLISLTVQETTALVSTHIFHQGEPLEYAA